MSTMRALGRLHRGRVDRPRVFAGRGRDTVHDSLFNLGLVDERVAGRCGRRFAIRMVLIVAVPASGHITRFG
jgi:hypothetical protein